MATMLNYNIRTVIQPATVFGAKRLNTFFLPNIHRLVISMHTRLILKEHVMDLFSLLQDRRYYNLQVFTFVAMAIPVANQPCCIRNKNDTLTEKHVLPGSQ